MSDFIEFEAKKESTIEKTEKFLVFGFSLPA